MFAHPVRIIVATVVVVILVVGGIVGLVATTSGPTVTLEGTPVNTSSQAFLNGQRCGGDIASFVSPGGGSDLADCPSSGANGPGVGTGGPAELCQVETPQDAAPNTGDDYDWLAGCYAGAGADFAANGGTGQPPSGN